MDITCFKAYDIRGRVPDQLNAEVAYRIGRAYADYLQPRDVVVGHDIRLSSRELCDALTRGLMDGGVDVIDIGQCGTEEIYFATSHLHTAGGIVVTASHNPMDYNGMKLVREGSRPISGDTGLHDIRRLAEAGEFAEPVKVGSLRQQDTRSAYIEHLLSYIDVSALQPLRLVINAGNGGAGPVADALANALPFEFVRVHHEPDGHFPNGVPNPLLEENRAPTIAAIKANKADMGIAWDGDFDRCFFFDESGDFVEGYYIVGLLAQSFLEREPGARIIHDPRLTWNTMEICEQLGGMAVQCKTGHAFIKERMRQEDAIYGGEMSAHHYFRDFAYCDSGMIPWLLVCELISRKGKPLSQLVAERMAAFPASGEINRTVTDAAALLAAVEKVYAPLALAVDHTDGLSMNFAEWRFNMRMSNTEPVVRLNVESRRDPALMKAKTAELLALMQP
ncbi:MAG: phosphomannomutase [Gammaproteobacteria bacterium]|nr:phosphomannomutase [Gammaproteobacteria bacterium]|tara:strand:- start:3811 stop:5157 length:1347 start_codon:yes stop_codon:yes gene_type:complete